MIIDNSPSTNKKVHEWISNYTETGKISIVTGYFTIGALCYLSRETNHKINEYKFILGDIISANDNNIRTIDLLNENIGIEAVLKLNQLAKEAIEFLELEKVNVKTLEPNFCHAKVYLFKDSNNEPQKNYYITGSSNLTEAGIGLKKTNNVELNLGSFGSEAQYNELMDWFENLWSKKEALDYKTVKDENGKNVRVPFKKYLIEEIKKIFRLYSPKELYFKVLFELFGEDLLLEKDNPEFNRQIGRLENSEIYNSLYLFQQKGVLSLIKMLQKYNGAILADAVGLGKTWSALAVMKFYQLQGRDIILLCPKKLQQNWRIYLKHQNSKFEKDGFEFFIRFHTDLNEDYMEKYQDTADKLFVNKRPKLFVIDESHNLRNDKSSRYKFFVEHILSKNEDAKVLLLSATPINNSLLDIRNQFKLISKGDAEGFNETLDIKNIDYTFRTAQKIFNDWASEEDPRIGEFIQKLPKNFFKLTDALTVARTRSMIQGQQNGLEFPEKQKPDNIFVTPKFIGNFESFEELLKHFPPMLSGYQPSLYITEYKEVDVLHDEKQRDRFLVKMMYILLVKRLESSWFSFASTVEKIINHHQNALDKIRHYQNTKSDIGLNEDAENIFEDDDLLEQLQDFNLGKKRKTRLIDIDRSGNIEHYKNDLKADIEALMLITANLDKFKRKIDIELLRSNNPKSVDEKLEKLIECIVQKRKKGHNNKNPKVLIFSVYKDTAFYLFHQLKARGFQNLAAIAGDSSVVWNEETESKKYETILERFAPYTKLFREKEWDFESSKLDAIDRYSEWKSWISNNDSKTDAKLQNPVDLLIATDVLSEGQNLQDCDMVINYDIHWNPVRIIQRMGRIDRLGSTNKIIFGVNFWPSDNINNYLNLQGRIEKRMAAMKLAGSEVNNDFSNSLKQMAEDESLEMKQKARMMEQMQSSWDEIDAEKTLGFDDFSLENFRQELLEELKEREKIYKAMPNGIYTGFLANPEICHENGIIALLGYPNKPEKSPTFRYRGYELVYIDYNGKSLLLNQKEVLDVLAFHKNKDRFVPKDVENGETESITKLSTALYSWLRGLSVTDELQEDGTVKVKMGKGVLELLENLKSGSKAATEKPKEVGSFSQKFNTENFDLITWFIISK